MANRKQPIRAERVVMGQDVTAEIARARENREEAAALRAESSQAQAHARKLREASNAILDTAVAISVEVLERHGISLAEPVGARFHPDEDGSMGVEITVRVKDPTSAVAARRALVERFGGEARCDRFTVT